VPPSQAGGDAARGWSRESSERVVEHQIVAWAERPRSQYFNAAVTASAAVRFSQNDAH
jgi:hypothetical protein